MEKYIGALFHSRTQTHVYHLQTSSYAKHVALGCYYDAIVPLIDSVVEMYQGMYGILRGYQGGVLKDLGDDQEIISYMDNLSQFVKAIREDLPQDKNLQNLYDEVEGLIDSTIYKLKFLG